MHYKKRFSAQVNGAASIIGGTDYHILASSAELVLPEQSTVLYAELIWGGYSPSYTGEEGIPAEDSPIILTNQADTFRLTAAGSIDPAAIAASKEVNEPGADADTKHSSIICYAEVTSVIQAGGAGIYTIGGLPGTGDRAEDRAGITNWVLAVLYQHDTKPFGEISLLVRDEEGVQPPENPWTAISGLCAPASSLLQGAWLVSAADMTLSFEENLPVSGRFMAVGAETEGRVRSYSLTEAPSSGTVVLGSTGEFGYRPYSGFTGTDAFIYSVTDNNGVSYSGSVTIRAAALQDVQPVKAHISSSAVQIHRPVNAAPVCEQAPKDDSDVESPPCSLNTPPGNGTAVVASDGSYTYTPNPHFKGMDSFTVKIRDPEKGTQTATVIVHVSAEADRADPDEAWTAEEVEERPSDE
ncbi:Ig-like domain-containing protein [Paenibacillus sp. FJAT-26967]|uniref:Ig-like domain-containing protein n=1 Tax=Paenibacillus sp. FJAT-26967 TaxID=1729690 RepID=UPI0008396540|nr:Ig-like domain-containing protein [Paenibacillus sp. FJAT-26967]